MNVTLDVSELNKKIRKAYEKGVRDTSNMVTPMTPAEFRKFETDLMMGVLKGLKGIGFELNCKSVEPFAELLRGLIEPLKPAEIHKLSDKAMQELKFKTLLEEL